MMYDDVTKNNQGSSNMFMAGSAWAFVFGPCIGGTSPKSVSVAKVHVTTCVCVCVCVVHSMLLEVSKIRSKIPSGN